jgi:hypothetical protein
MFYRITRNDLITISHRTNMKTVIIRSHLHVARFPSKLYITYVIM